jgi:hypothetical protein
VVVVLKIKTSTLASFEDISWLIELEFSDFFGAIRYGKRKIFIDVLFLASV